MKTPAKYDRRLFLRGLGVGVGMLPILESEWAKAGCVVAPPRRFMSIVYTNGATNSKYWPTGSSADGYTLNEVTAPFEAVKDKVTFVNGIQFRTAMDSPNNVSGHHDLPSVLTGVPMLEHVHARAIAIAGGPSIDPDIVDELRKSKPNEPRSLNIAYRPTREPQTSWRGARMPESAQTDLFKVFNQILGGTPTVNPSISPEELKKLRAARASMLDVVGKDIERFCKNLGKDDRDRCGGHVNSFREIEKAFGMQKIEPPMIGGVCGAPQLGPAFTDRNEDMAKWHDALTKLVVAAFATNKTRSINFQFGDSVNDSISYPHLGLPRVNGVSIYDGGSGVDHGEAHNNTKTHHESRKWFFGWMSGLFKAMMAVKEDNNRTLLDNSVVYAVSNMSTGGGHDVGRSIPLPALYAGSCGGYLKTGQYIRLPAKVAHNRLFYAFMNAMGVDPKGYDGGRYGGELTEVRA